MVTVPDPRLAALSAISKSKALLPTNFEFVDIAGLVRGASKGEGLGNQFLANIRETDAVCQARLRRRRRCFLALLPPAAPAAPAAGAAVLHVRGRALERRLSMACDSQPQRDTCLLRARRPFRRPPHTPSLSSLSSRDRKQVVRCFEDDDIIHVAGKVNPLDDVDVINLELALADLGTIEKRLERMRKGKKSKEEADKARAVLLLFWGGGEEGRGSRGRKWCKRGGASCGARARSGREPAAQPTPPHNAPSSLPRGRRPSRRRRWRG